MPTNPEQPVELEYLKLLVRPVVQRRQNGKVIGETISEEVSIYDIAEIPKLVAEMERQIAELNAAARPNRQQRRARQPKKSRSECRSV